jgi:hypothetical protein
MAKVISTEIFFESTLFLDHEKCGVTGNFLGFTSIFKYLDYDKCGAMGNFTGPTSFLSTLKIK